MNNICEPIYSECFFRIIMRAKTGKKLYLKEDHLYGKNKEKVNCSWSLSWQDCIWFKTEQDAKDFANNYFKNFKNYEVEGFEYIM